MREVGVDVVVIGSGAGGGTMARALAGSNAEVLVLERGPWLTRGPRNADPVAVWQERQYRTDERWLNSRGQEFSPFMHYVVGGNTTMWGAALLRLRTSDFDAARHRDGLSPAWPIGYDDLQPWYDEAERIFHVHGTAGEDPTDPPRGPFPYPAVEHEPFVGDVVRRLRAQGLHPSHLPLGLIDPGTGDCLLCNTCNSFPCQYRGKADADVVAMTPALRSSNVSLWTDARVQRLVADTAGDRVESVEVLHRGELVRVRAGTVVLSAGAVNSAALLLRSGDRRHPQGLANSSGLVGRRYMAHQSTMMQAVHPLWANDTVFQKTVSINDFYLPTADRPALGHIQSQGRAHVPIVKQVARMVPAGLTQAWIDRGVDWLAMSEDLPHDDNRVRVTPSGRIQLDYTPNNRDAHRMLVREATAMLRRLGYWLVVRHTFKDINTTHQCGTATFGEDPHTSVLDPWCRSHDVGNLFVVDASFMPSSAAVNPALTVVAQALRAADHLVRTDLGEREGLHRARALL